MEQFKLRKFKIEDAPLMYEWMHDENVLCGLHRDKFINKTMSDCERFIAYTQQPSETDLHLAIVDENDEYAGTVSLQHIAEDKSLAEFTIAVRTKYQGTGAAAYGMVEIINYGLKNLGVKEIFWSVLADNARAMGLYDKCGYTQYEKLPEVIREMKADLLAEPVEYNWYHALM